MIVVESPSYIIKTMDSNYQDQPFQSTSLNITDDADNDMDSYDHKSLNQNRPYFFSNNDYDLQQNNSIDKVTQSFNFLSVQNQSLNMNNMPPSPSSPSKQANVNSNENFLARLLADNHIPEKNHAMIYEAIEKWKQNISLYLTTQTSSTSINEIYNRVPNPTHHIIPKSIKLVDILKYDSENRFYVTGEGNSLKIKYNFKLSSQEIEQLQSQWRENISKYLSTQSSAISLSDIGANVMKPFHLPNTIKLLETIQNDPQNRFVISGTFINTTFYNSNSTYITDCNYFH